MNPIVHSCRRMLSGLVILPVSAIARAQEQAPAEAVVEKVLPTLPAAQDPVSMTSLWQLTMGMLLVLGLIIGLAWLLKRSGRFQMAAGGGLRVLGGLSMGARERVVLIQAGETQLLLGVAPGRVQTLHVLDQPMQTDTAASGGFAEQLSKVLKKDNPA